MSTPDQTTTSTTRELWLERAIDTFRPQFETVGYPLPERFHVSVGFGYGAKRENAKLMGQCWSGKASADGINHLFISPEIDDTEEVLRTLLHELIHAALDSPEGIADGHKKRFAEIATRLGFLGPMTETPASPTLQAEFLTIAAVLGEYPHSALQVATARAEAPVPVGGGNGGWHSGPRAQTNRHAKVACSACGYTFRTTAKWIEVGLPPACVCGGTDTFAVAP